jgi:hypothetical protein
MGFDNWNAIIDPSLQEPIPVCLSFFNRAASQSAASIHLLDRLRVIHVWLNKQSQSELEHEYIIIETKDASDKDAASKMFIIERTVTSQGTVPRSNAPQRPTPPTKKDSSYQALENVQQEITNYIRSPSRSITPLSAMEEGTLSTSTSTLHPLSFQRPQYSKGDTLSLSATKASQAVSQSLDNVKRNNVEVNACDRILGEAFLHQSAYGCGRVAVEIMPSNLTLFEMVVIAQAVHDFAPQYTMLERNCYWFCNMVVDVLMEVNSVQAIGTVVTGDDGVSYMKKDPDIRGRWRGWKVTQTDPEEVSTIVRNFKKSLSEELKEVKLFFF